MRWNKQAVSYLHKYISEGLSYAEIANKLSTDDDYVTTHAVKIKCYKLGLYQQATVYKETYRCQVCGAEICDYVGNKRKYCSNKCHGDARVGTRRQTKRKAATKVCPWCSSTFTKKNTKYCSSTCYSTHKLSILQAQSSNRFNEGKLTNGSLRKYLLQVMDYKCSACGNTEWCGKPIPLDVDHIDGNHTNNTLDNLRFLCPNCHAQTPTYKNKNKGNGRAARRKQAATIDSGQ